MITTKSPISDVRIRDFPGPTYQSIRRAVERAVPGRTPLACSDQPMQLIGNNLYVPVFLPIPLSCIRFPYVLHGLAWAKEGDREESLGRFRVVAYDNVEGHDKLKARLEETREMRVEWTTPPGGYYQITVQRRDNPDWSARVQVAADSPFGAVEVAAVVFPVTLGWVVSYAGASNDKTEESPANEKRRTETVRN